MLTELLRRVEKNEARSAKELAILLFGTASLRSGHMPQKSAVFADTVEKLIRQTMDIPVDEQSEGEIGPLVFDL